MFSRNKKISQRQIFRNYGAGLIALAIWVIPPIVNANSASAVALGVLLAGILLYWSGRVTPPCSLAVKILCYAHYWVIGTMLARVTGLLIQEYLLTDTSMFVILGWFYLFLFYNLYKGLECRMRVSEILFPFFLFLMALLCLLLYEAADFGRCLEIRWNLNRDIWKMGYQLFCWLGAGLNLWHLKNSTKEEKEWRSAVWKTWLAETVAVCVLVVLIYGIYGNKGHTGLLFPMGAAQTLAHFPGNVVGRLDALFAFGWIIGLFLLGSSLFAPLMGRELSLREKYLYFALLAGSLALAIRPDCMEWGSFLIYYVTTPLQILILLGCSLKGKNQKVLSACLVLGIAFLLTGCGQQELEKRGIVTAVGIDPAEGEDLYQVTFVFGSAASEEKEEDVETFQTSCNSLKEAKKDYRELHQKELDFNHLKIIYVAEEILQENSFGDVLEEIQLDSSYSRGTSVYAAQGIAGKEALREETPENGRPIHDLLNAYYNQESCEIPTVTQEHLFKGSILWQY